LSEPVGGYIDWSPAEGSAQLEAGRQKLSKS
jgi:hypothetical protein